MQRDTVFGTFVVAAVLCIVCSVAVSLAAVGLRPYQEANKKLFQRQNILKAAGIEGETADEVEAAFENIETLIIDLETGKPADGIDLAAFDQRAAAKNPEQSIEIPGKEDKAGIKRREKYSLVYLVKNNGQLEKVVLPVYGKGLWSTLYGYLALEGDLETVGGLTFYEHAETPGLGGEVDNPSWKAKWPGKKLYDDEGNVEIEVIKGQVVPGAPEAIHQIDGLSGATITSKGVSELVRYWISDQAFGPFLEQLRKDQ